MIILGLLAKVLEELMDAAIEWDRSTASKPELSDEENRLKLAVAELREVMKGTDA